MGNVFATAERTILDDANFGIAGIYTPLDGLSFPARAVPTRIDDRLSVFSAAGVRSPGWKLEFAKTDVPSPGEGDTWVTTHPAWAGTYRIRNVAEDHEAVSHQCDAERV